jgi:hypothetical protein
MNKSRSVTRRHALQLGATAAALPLVHIRTAGAAGKLTVGIWDHWVPPANDAMKTQVNTWADKNKVDVTIDFITSNGGKIDITQAAEAQAKTGHDFLPFGNWQVNTYADQLEPMDDVVKAMTAQYGQYSPIHEYLSKIKGSWRALPSSTGTLNLNCCARISLLKQHAGIDIVEMYPAHKSDPKGAANWTYECVRLSPHTAPVRRTRRSCRYASVRRGRGGSDVPQGGGGVPESGLRVWPRVGANR